MITVGLDFGTHQTKVCMERKEGTEINYQFFQFKDCKRQKQFTLPSIIQIGEDNRLSYGYIPKSSKGRIIRYFKQGTFTKLNGMAKDKAIYYSIWYLAYVFFLLEKEYGQNFSVQMGVPTDVQHLNRQKQLAVQIVLSAYRLVEDVFQNEMDVFLACTMDELKTVTQLVPYSEGKKQEYGILVFPEAYACLMPLIQQKKLDGGMHLMIDIGGGTTDISFFTLEYTNNDKQKAINERLHVYGFYSINKGLNFLTDADANDMNRKDSNVLHEDEILYERMANLRSEIKGVHTTLVNKLKAEYKQQCSLPVERLMDALGKRPLIYTGGGSRFPKLRSQCGGFIDIIPISEREWRKEVVTDIEYISKEGLCPILSTAYGLSMSMPHDNVACEPFTEIFKGLRDMDHPYKQSNNPPSSLIIGQSKKKKKMVTNPIMKKLDLSNHEVDSDYSLYYDSWK
jgi:hypothetical protein